MHFQIYVTAQHYRGKKNVLADALSWGKNAPLSSTGLAAARDGRALNLVTILPVASQLENAPSVKGMPTSLPPRTYKKSNPKMFHHTLPVSTAATIQLNSIRSRLAARQKKSTFKFCPQHASVQQNRQFHRQQIPQGIPSLMQQAPPWAHPLQRPIKLKTRATSHRSIARPPQYTKVNICTVCVLPQLLRPTNDKHPAHTYPYS